VLLCHKLVEAVMIGLLIIRDKLKLNSMFETYYLVYICWMGEGKSWRNGKLAYIRSGWVHSE